MTNKIKYLFLPIFFCLISNISYSQESYCLDKNGLILPLFDSDNCVDANDVKIDQKEFTYIIETEASERFSKLNGLRTYLTALFNRFDYLFYLNFKASL